MQSNVSFFQFPNKMKSKEKLPAEYKEELLLYLLNININREVILSFILLAIDVFLLILDIISTKGWRTNLYIYGHFSFAHMMLLIIPIIFLLTVYVKKEDLKSNVNLCRFMHLSINFLVLIFCSIISAENEATNKLPYTYLIAMFCIASIVLLGKKERFLMYISSCIIYIGGSIAYDTEIYHLIGDIFFFSILVALALIVSNINYLSYTKDFINQKIIMDKNKELDKLYKETEATLINRTKELNETVEYDKLRVAFFANISHELRTPLTVIFSAEQMLDMLIKKENFQDRKQDFEKYMNIVKQNCYRLIRLVANLIDITKIDAGYFNVNLKNCNIIKVVEDITLSVAKFIEDRDIRLIFDTDAEELITACDPDKIERIVLNLLSNAVKFTPSSGSIFVNIYDKTDIVEIHIKDTGIGIPENMRQSIFERFVQVDKTTSRNHEGSGIGLSLVRSLVNMQGGIINLISEEGKGSEFIVALPKKLVSCEEIVSEYNLDYEKQNVEKINIEFSDIYK